MSPPDPSVPAVADPAACDLAHARRIAHPHVREDGIEDDEEAVAPGMFPPLSAFMQGFLTRIVEVVGKVPAHALFQFGAHEEGRRWAAEHREADLQDTLLHVGRAFGHKATVLEDSQDLVRLEVTDCWLLQVPALESVLSGLLEGIVSAKKGHRFRARIARMGSGEHVSALVDLAPKQDRPD